MNYTDKIKITIIGEEDTGKTFFCRRLLNPNFFETEYSSTLGVDFFLYRYKTKNKLIQANIWDLTGNDKFYPIIHSYLKNNNFFLLFCDVTNIQSIKSLNKWIDRIRQENTYKNKLFISIICSKNDSKKTTQKINNLNIEEYIKNFSEQFHCNSYKNGNIYYTDKNSNNQKIIQEIISEYFKFQSYFGKINLNSKKPKNKKKCWQKFTYCIKNIFTK